jgi:hypothetical protein
MAQREAQGDKEEQQADEASQPKSTRLFCELRKKMTSASSFNNISGAHNNGNKTNQFSRRLRKKMATVVKVSGEVNPSWGVR